MLNTEEIAMNYLMITVSTLVALLDFGFTPQISRLVSYVCSGAQSLHKDGLIERDCCEINYALLYRLIDVTKQLFRKLSILILLVLLTLGSWYMYHVTKGFTLVDNSFIIWIIFSVSNYFSILYKYLDTILIGRGLIQESKKAMLASRLTYILLTYLFLLLGGGLLGVCIAGLISPFVQQFLARHYFYDNYIKEKFSHQTYTDEEGKEIFGIIWFNAKKLGINFLGSYCITRFSMFIAGLYLDSKDIASYGLMMQAVTVIIGISTTFYNTIQPQIISCRVEGNREKTISTFSFTMIVYYILFITGSIVLIIVGPVLLGVIGSNAILPTTTILSLYLFINLLEQNHSLFATFITTGNKVPFIPAALISGSCIVLGDILVLHFLGMGLLALVIVQGVVQGAYNNLKWPKWVLDEYHITFFHFMLCGFKEFSYKIITQWQKLV